MTPRPASDHPGLEVTGLSAGAGGWLGRRPFRFDDPVYAGAFPEGAARVRRVLEDRFARGALRVAALPRALDHAPHRGLGPLSADRVHGLLLGAAVGDALGNTSESMSPAERAAAHGEIRDYLPNRHAEGRRVGLPSDDTQLTVWLLEALLDEGQPDPAAIARAFRRHRVFGIGRTMRDWFEALDTTDGGDPWEARQRSAGNGALMRVAGAVLPHAWTLDAGALDTALLTSALTHDHPSSNGACAAFAELLLGVLWANPPLPAGWFVETFVRAARSVEGEARLESRVPGLDFTGPLWRFVERELPRALDRGLSVRETCDAWHSGAYLLETVPSVLYILERHGRDPEEALVRAVNDTWDNDTIAAIVGGVLGAAHGASALPARWRRGLLGRTTTDDDGELDHTWARLRALGGFGLQD